jgi:hypothetical protein
MQCYMIWHDSLVVSIKVPNGVILLGYMCVCRSETCYELVAVCVHLLHEYNHGAVE